MNDQGVHHETNIPAEQHPPQTHPRLSGPDADQKRSRNPSPPARQGQKTTGRLTFREQDRIKTRPEFLTCYARGRKYYSRFFLLFCLPDAARGQSGTRLGLSVGRKIGNAVKRNRLKRLLREFFRQHREAFFPGCDIVVVAKRGIDPMKLQLIDVQEDLLAALRRLRRDMTAAGAAHRSNHP
jgi:ribonuclease P protein component